ncbi:hypothetical protein Tco_0494736 [Tanacetum coccineum]
MYHQKNVDYVELLWEDFIYQIDNKVYKKQEKMYYPQEKISDLWSCSNEALLSQEMKESKSKESELVPKDEEPVKKGKRLKTPAKRFASKPATGIVIREPPVETKSKRKEKEKVDVAHEKGIGNDEDDKNNEQESSDESNKQENESEEQELDSEQDGESDDDDQEEEEFDQENESEDDEMKSDEEQGMD